jgi:hypothetical protein
MNATELGALPVIVGLCTAAAVLNIGDRGVIHRSARLSGNPQIRLRRHVHQRGWPQHGRSETATLRGCRVTDVWWVR